MFPANGVLDNFNRANQAPLAGNWSQPVVDFTANRINLVANQIVGNAATNQAAWWNVTTFGPNSEAYITVTNPDDSNHSIRLFLRLQSPGSGDIFGYDLNFISASGTDTWQVERIDDSVYTQLGASVSQEISANDKIGVEMIGSTINVYYFTGGAWGAALLSRTDTTYTTAGQIGVGVDGTAITLDDFGGGTVVAASTYFRPKIEVSREAQRRKSSWNKLGRARRERAGYKRGLRNAPTATPLVRKRQVVKLDPRRSRVRAIGIARRLKVKLVRGLRNLPTATPLIRKRIVVRMDARPAVWARLGRARRIRAQILRAIISPLIPAVPKQPILRLRARRPLLRRRHDVILRAISIMSATPLVRNRVLIRTDTRRAIKPTLGRLRRIQPKVLHGLRFAATATSLVRPVIIASKRRLHPHFRRHVLDFARSRVPAVRPPRQLISQNADTASRHVARFKRHIRSLVQVKVVFIAPVQPPHAAVVRKDRNVLRRAIAWRGIVLVIRAPSVTTATPLVRNRVLIRTDLRRSTKPTLGRGRRLRAKILHGLQYAATATPLIRNRVLVKPRTSLRVKFFKQRLERVVIKRSPSTPTLQYRPPRQLVIESRRGARIKRRVKNILRSHVYFIPAVQPARQSIIRKDTRAMMRRALLWRGVTVTQRGRSVTTATAFIRKQQIVKRSTRALTRRSLGWRAQIVLRAPAPLLVKSIRNRLVLPGKNRRVYLRHRPKIIKRAPITSMRRMQPYVVARLPMRPKPRRAVLLRPKQPAIVVRRRVITETSRPASRVKLRRWRTPILRSRFFPVVRVKGKQPAMRQMSHTRFVRISTRNNVFYTSSFHKVPIVTNPETEMGGIIVGPVGGTISSAGPGSITRSRRGSPSGARGGRIV